MGWGFWIAVGKCFDVQIIVAGGRTKEKSDGDNVPDATPPSEY